MTGSNSEKTRVQATVQPTVRPERRRAAPESKAQNSPDASSASRIPAVPTGHAARSDPSTPLRYAQGERGAPLRLTHPARFALLAVLTSSLALAASRPDYGGAAKVAVTVPALPTEPALADSPAEAALLQLTTTGICRDTPTGWAPTLARTISQAPDRVTITLAPGLAIGSTPVTSLDVASAWGRLFTETPSPYRGLFAAVRGGEAGVRGATSGRDGLVLPLAFPWPDLAASLCHPALALTVPTGPGVRAGIGPFAGTRELRARLDFPRGRPYLDRLLLEPLDPRAALRQAALGRADLVLGAAPAGQTSTGPALYATYLLFRPERVGSAFRDRVLARVHPEDLVRYFVPAPAVPMRSILPPAMDGTPAAPAPASPPPPNALPAGTNTFAIAFDAGNPTARAVAERIALELGPDGVRLTLRPLARAALRQAWASGDYDLLLDSVLLPPQPAAALAVVLTLAHADARLSGELPPLGAIADPATRAQRTAERAAALASQLPLVPLYAEGARLQIGAHLAGLLLDTQGVPDLPDASLLHD